MLPRLKKLAQRAATFAEFIDKAARFVNWYGFPGTGTRDDYQTFFNAVKRGK